MDILWQWQSGIDPWKEKDSTKWTWECYSDDECLILERAYSFKLETTSLEQYDINFKDMLQTHKTYRNRTRRIRRQEKSEFSSNLPEPKSLVKGEKTMNEALGSFQQFLSSIIKRTPEASELYKTLQNLSLGYQPAKFEQVTQQVIGCIEKGAKVREDSLKARPGYSSYDVNYLVSEIKGNSKNFKNFLKTILKVYTMETFLPYWLNEILRSESDEEINVMLPYLVCLAFTFSHPAFKFQYKKPKRFFWSKRKACCLYRGMALEEAQIDFYRKKKGEFSWFGITSTSTSIYVARWFMSTSLGKAEVKKMGVIFFIEAEDGEGMIDTLQNSCSAYPNEQEVILVPGTIFKVQGGVNLNKYNEYEIRLKIVKGAGKNKKVG